MTQASQRQYTLGEEWINAISHGVGALLGIAGTVVLILWAVSFSDVWGVVSGSIYGFTLILLYTMSTLYHALTNERAKAVLQVLDHTTIFLLIAGTYTPYTLVTIRGPMGWVVFGLVWCSAIVGIILNAISLKRFKRLSMILYIASGWAVVMALGPMFEQLDPMGLILLGVGGIFYTVGIVFYSMKKRKYFHAVWHFFVLGGSLSHYLSILLYVIR